MPESHYPECLSVLREEDAMSAPHIPECPKGGCPGCHAKGYAEALTAAHDAVAAVDHDTMCLLHPRSGNVPPVKCTCVRDFCLAAIDALRGESNG